MADLLSDAAVQTLLKTWYTDEETQNLLFRNSPFLKKVPKEQIGGKEYAISMTYSRGGNVAGNYFVLSQGMVDSSTGAIASQSKAAEGKVTPGKLFAAITLTVPEILASSEKRGAYTPIAIQKMFTNTDAFRKTLARACYMLGFGECGALVNSQSQTDTTMVLTPDGAFNLDIGSKFVVTTTALASSALGTAGSNAGVYTVTKMQNVTSVGVTTVKVTFTPALQEAAGWTAGWWVELYQCRDSSNNPLLPVGLGGWLPTVASRTGATWDSYIGTSFYGIDRSVAPDKMAGQFYVRNSGGAEKYIDAMVQGLKLARRGGGVPDMIYVNDDDYLQIVSEAEAQRTFFQSINESAAKKSKNVVTKGISDFQFAFSSSWIQFMYDDPACPKGTAYILDSAVVKFVSITNLAKPAEGSVADNDPGKEKVSEAEEPDYTFKLLLDDFVSTKPVDTIDGPGIQVTINFIGNIVVLNPSNNCVVAF